MKVVFRTRPFIRNEEKHYIMKSSQSIYLKMGLKNIGSNNE